MTTRENTTNEEQHGKNDKHVKVKETFEVIRRWQKKISNGNKEIR
jgi:hypothetical protein